MNEELEKRAIQLATVLFEKLKKYWGVEEQLEMPQIIFSDGNRCYADVKANTIHIPRSFLVKPYDLVDSLGEEITHIIRAQVIGYTDKSPSDKEVNEFIGHIGAAYADSLIGRRRVVRDDYTPKLSEYDDLTRALKDFFRYIDHIQGYRAGQNFYEQINQDPEERRSLIRASDSKIREKYLKIIIVLSVVSTFMIALFSKKNGTILCAAVL